jgi:hypothetical protein
MAAIDAAYGCFRLERLEGQLSTIMTPGERKSASGPLDCMSDARQLDSDPVISQLLDT